MSSGVGCEFHEVELGKWFYILGTEDDEDAWDWRELATAYGPFDDQEEARGHLLDNHQNPGHSTVVPYDAQRRPDRLLIDLIANTRDPRSWRC